MNQNFETLMASKTNEVLQEYIVNSGKYQRDAVSAAINELKKRGQTFNDVQLTDIYNKVQAKEDEANKGELFLDKKVTAAYWKRNIVLDTDAPILYSEQAIWGFSIFFSALSGAILLAINLSRLGKKGAAFITLIFGLGYTFITYWFVTAASSKPSSTPAYLMGMLGGIILTQIFWKKFIGKDTKYRVHTIWVPLVICLVILALIILAMLQSSN